MYVSAWEFDLRYHCVSPFGMAVFTLSGWYDVLCTYTCSCLLIGLMCVFTSRSPVSLNLGPLYTVMSKKVSSWSLCSNINLIVGCSYFVKFLL